MLMVEIWEQFVIDSLAGVEIRKLTNHLYFIILEHPETSFGSLLISFNSSIYNSECCYSFVCPTLFF